VLFVGAIMYKNHVSGPLGSEDVGSTQSSSRMGLGEVG
jgi:hypothetical protein